MYFPKIIVDVLLVAACVVGLVVSFKRGFVRIVAKPVKFILSIAFAFSLCGKLADAWLGPIIRNPIAARLSQFLHESAKAITPANAATDLPTLLKIAAGAFNIDIAEIAETATGDLIDEIVLHLTDPVAHYVGAIVCFLILYFAMRILLWIAIGILDLICRKSGLSVANKVLGAIVGGAATFFAVWGVVCLFDFALGTKWLADTELALRFAESGGPIYNFFSNLNPLDLLLSF